MKRLILVVVLVFVLVGCNSNEAQSVPGIQIVPEAQAQGGVRQFWSDGIEEQGATKKIHFHIQLQEPREWHYFGSTAAEFPPNEPGNVFEHAEIQFPRDFSELGEEQNNLLYDLALRAGLIREGLE